MATKYHVQHVKSNLKNSEANGPKLPTSEQIEFGEIAINYLKDYETISIKNSEQEIVTFSSDASVNKKLETKADKARVDEIDEVVSKAFDAMNKSCGFSEEVAYTPQNELIRYCVSLSEAMEIVAEKANSGTGSGISDAPSDGKKYVRQDANWVEETKVDTDTFATKADASALAQKQDTLVSGTNIKTINGQSLLGEGNIEIQGGTGGISDAPSDGKKYVRQNANWVEETSVDTSLLATKEELALKADKTAIADMATKTWVGEQNYLTEHQDISTLATKSEVTEGLAKKQDTLVSGSNIKTVNGESILGSGDITVVKSKIMTQQEYDELGEKDNNTVYFIVG